jgi:hypothetical protein
VRGGGCKYVDLADSVKLIQLQHGQRPEIDARGWLYIGEDIGVRCTS